MRSRSNQKPSSVHSAVTLLLSELHAGSTSLIAHPNWTLRLVADTMPVALQQRFAAPCYGRQSIVVTHEEEQWGWLFRAIIVDWRAFVISSDKWEYLEQPLGPPHSDLALERSRELVADGWEFLGVRFSQGLWLYRRRVPVSDAGERPLQAE